MTIAQIIYDKEKSHASTLKACYATADNVHTYKYTGNTQFTFVDGSRIKLSGTTNGLWVV